MDLPLALNIATTLAVVGGVVFGAWQIRAAAKARTTQVSLQLVEMLYSRDLIEGLSALNDDRKAIRGENCRRSWATAGLPSSR